MTAFLTKKFEPNLNMLRESREKHLDNVTELLYNIRTRYKEKGNKMTIRKETFSTNVDTTISNDRILSEEYALVKELSTKVGCTAVIAGGSVRDTLLGLPFRDIDIFILGTGPEDDDNVVYFTELYREKRPRLDKAASAIGGGYDYKVHFPGYEFTSANLDQGVGFNELMEFRPVQFIGRQEETPEDLVDSFDYDLVRCWYDGEYHIDSRFELALKGKRVPSNSQHTYERIHAWKQRTGFKITAGRPKTTAAKPTLTSSTSQTFPLPHLIVGQPF